MEKPTSSRLVGFHAVIIKRIKQDVNPRRILNRMMLRVFLFPPRKMEGIDLTTLIVMYPKSGVKIYHFESPLTVSMMKRSLKIGLIPFICIEDDLELSGGRKNDVEFRATPSV